MAMYRFFQTEEDGPWNPITDSETVVVDAMQKGAKKLTILAVDAPLGADDAKRGHKYNGPLYFDIDVEGAVEEAIKSAQQLVNNLIQIYETPEEAIQIFCSGKKGLHVLVDQRGFMPRNTAIKDLPLIYKVMASELYVSGMDLSPYACGRNNTFRIANLKRYDGNYRVPIRIRELFELDADSYARFVSKPRKELVHTPYKGPHSIKLNVLFSTATDKVGAMERELTERSRNTAVAHLDRIADQAPPCVEAIAGYKGLKSSTTFNQVALNLGLWASRAGAPEFERNRIFAMTADNAERTDRYPTPRARMVELDGKYKFTVNSPDYKFGCGAMRSMLTAGRKICEGCPLENSCKGSNTAEFLSDIAEKSGISKNDSGYLRQLAKGRTEQISTFTLEAQAAYMEDMPDGTGTRRRGTLCRVMRYGEKLGSVIMDEAAWASKSSFLRALEGINGVYYTGGDAEIQKIKMLVFLEEENMPEIHQVTAAGIHIERRRDTDLITFVEPGKSLNNLQMVDTHRLTKVIPLPPSLFKQVPLEIGDAKADQALANLCKSNQQPVMAISLGWIAACHLKQHLREAYGQFPLLSLWGGSGAGKSKLAELLVTLHGLNCNQRSKANMTGMKTAFNAVELLSGTTTVPRLCEEYNRDKIPEHQYLMLGELFKALWNSESSSRGTVVQGQRSPVSIEIPLTSPALILSEQQIKMPALLERTLVVKMIKAGRNREAFFKAQDGRQHLMRLGQRLMQGALRLPISKVEQMVEMQGACVGTQFDDRPRYSLMVVHMGLAWLIETCTQLRMQDSVHELTVIKNALTEITAEADRVEEDDPSLSLSGVLGRSQVSEVDQFMIQLADIISESGALMYEETQSGRPGARRPLLSPRTDFRVAGDKLYLWGKTCHSRYLEWYRTTGRRSPLEAWSDLKQLVEHEPYFIEWKSLDDFAFGEPAMVLDMAQLKLRNVHVDSIRRVYEVLGTIDL